MIACAVIIYFQFELSLKLSDVENPARGHKVVKHHPEGGKRSTYSLNIIQDKEKSAKKMVKNYPCKC